MKIALKYGLLITVGVIAWVVIAHLLVPDPTSGVHSLGAGVFFNLLEIAGIYLGINARQVESAGVLSFKRGLKTGVAIAFVYAVSASLFFTLMVITAPHWMPREPGGQTLPLWQMVLQAFIGLIVGAVLLGLIYSTIITFVVVRRQKGRSYD